MNIFSDKLKYYSLGLFIVTALSFFTIGCADDPSSLGLDFIPPGETTGVRIFDSYIDTMPITSQSVKYYTNTSQSANFMIGKTSSYDAKGLLKFNGISGDYDSATVNSATLTLTYKNYYFPAAQSDSLGQVSFDVYSVQQNLNYNTITLDSVNSGSFGTTSWGNYTGSPTADTQQVTITLNTQLAKDWLEYAADTNYSVKNYGVALTPSVASTVIKGFYSGLDGIGDNVTPKLQIIVTKNGDTDTLNILNSETISLVDATIAPNSETFSLQAGVSYVNVMKFDMSRLPSDATINDVQLYLTLDDAGSEFTSLTTYTVSSIYISDTTGFVTAGGSFNGGPDAASGKYMIRLVAGFQVSPFQRWLLGEANHGIMLFAANQQRNLDLFSFYGPTASDPNKRPRVVIKYTPRVTPKPEKPVDIEQNVDIKNNIDIKNNDVMSNSKQNGGIKK